MASLFSGLMGSGLPMSEVGAALSARQQEQQDQIERAALAAKMAPPPVYNAQGFEMLPGVRNNQGFFKRDYTPAEIATLQNLATTTGARSAVGRRAGVGDGVTPDDYVASPVFPQGDLEMAKQQLVSGGGNAWPILRENSGLPEGTARPGFGSNGRISYEGITPIHDADEIMGNSKFQLLANKDPKAAATLFKEFTGKDFATHVSERQKEDLSRVKDYQNTIRDQLNKGDLRRNPTMGWLERARQVRDLVGNVTTEWEPVDPTLHEADKQYGGRATGFPRGGTIIDAVPLEGRGVFQQAWYAAKKAGKNDYEATTEARNALGEYNNRGIIASNPATVRANPPDNTLQTPFGDTNIARQPPTDPVAFQQWMTQEANKSNQNVGNFFTKTLPTAVDRGLDKTVGNVGRALTWAGHEIIGGAQNMENRIDLGLGYDKPRNEWWNPMPWSVVTDPNTTRLPEWMRHYK
jgi:hypothetical protein